MAMKEVSLLIPLFQAILEVSPYLRLTSMEDLPGIPTAPHRFSYQRSPRHVFSQVKQQ
jgi:hypothetical protein